MWNAKAQVLLAKLQKHPAGQRYLDRLGAAYQDYIFCLEETSNPQELEDAAAQFLLAHYLHQAILEHTTRKRKAEEAKLKRMF